MNFLGITILLKSDFDKYEKAVEDNEYLQNRVSTLENTMNREKERFNSYSREMEFKLSELDNKDKEIITLGESVSKHQDRIDELSKTSKSLTKKVKDLSVEKMNLKRELSDSEKTISELNGQIELLQNSLAEKDKLIAALESYKEEVENNKLQKENSNPAESGDLNNAEKEDADKDTDSTAIEEGKTDIVPEKEEDITTPSDPDSGFVFHEIPHENNDMSPQLDNDKDIRRKNKRRRHR